MQTRRPCTREFELEADKLVITPGVTLNQVGEELGIHPHVPDRRRKRPEKRPLNVHNHLAREIAAHHPDTEWATDVTWIRTAGSWLYLRVVLDLRSGVIVGWSMSKRQDRQLVIQAVLMALWRRPNKSPAILHPDRSCQFTSDKHQRSPADHDLVCSMSADGSAADNAAVEGFCGPLERERVNRRQCRTRSDARADDFDNIERFHDPRKRRLPEGRDQGRSALTQTLVDTE